MSDDPLSPGWRVQLNCVCYDAFIDLRPVLLEPICVRIVLHLELMFFGPQSNFAERQNFGRPKQALFKTLNPKP
jgi:hypothetical protein